jgi:hypothetical protein
MGEGGQGIAAISSENHWVRTCEAHYVGCRTQENRGGAASAMGKDTSGEEGGVVSLEACCEVRQAFVVKAGLPLRMSFSFPGR